MKINKKKLLVVGKSEIERKNVINKIIDNSNLDTFRFPKAMKSNIEYFDFCDKKNLYLDWKDTISHIDWITENESLIILEEFQYMEKEWNVEILNCYIEASENHKRRQKTAKVIISQDTENGLFEKLENKITLRKNEKRTKRQIIEQNLEIIIL